MNMMMVSSELVHLSLGESDLWKREMQPNVTLQCGFARAPRTHLKTHSGEKAGVPVLGRERSVEKGKTLLLLFSQLEQDQLYEIELYELYGN